MSQGYKIDRWIDADGKEHNSAIWIPGVGGVGTGSEPSKLFAPSIQRCAGCRFVTERTEAVVSGNTTVSRCHRHPPAYTQDGGFPKFPRVNPNHDWCGDFEPREVEKPAESKS